MEIFITEEIIKETFIQIFGLSFLTFSFMYTLSWAVSTAWSYIRKTI